MIGKINTKGLNVNGLIEEYKVASGGKVSAGDFVEFVNNSKVDTVGMNIYRAAISAVALDENRVFIAYLVCVDSNYKIYGKICTVNGTKITYSLDTVLKSYGNLIQSISVVKLNNNRIAISYIYEFESASLSGLKLEVFNINGSEITQSMVDFGYVDAGITGYSTLSTIALDENRVLAVFTCKLASTNPYVLLGVVFKITDELNHGSMIYMTEVSSSDMKKNLSVIALNANKVFVAYSSKSNTLHGIICTIDEMLIKLETDTELSEDKASGDTISAVILSENKVFIGYSGGVDEDGIRTYCLYGMLCSIDEVSVNVINNVLLNSEVYSGSAISAILINENKVLIVHSCGSERYLCKMICSIQETEILMEADTVLRRTTQTNNAMFFSIAATKCNENNVFIAYSETNGLPYMCMNCILQSIIPEVKCLSRFLKQIAGVAKTSGQAGEFVKVIIPKYMSESEE